MDAMRLDDWKKSLRFFITYSIFVISSTVRRVSHAAFSALGETLSAGDDAIISDVGSILVVMHGKVEPSTGGAVNTNTIVLSYDPRCCGKPQKKVWCRGREHNDSNPHRRGFVVDHEEGVTTTTVLVVVSASSCILCYQNEFWCRQHRDRSIILHLLVHSTTTRDS